MEGRAQVREVLRLTPRKRQTLLFSATMTEEVRALAALSLQRPVRLAADAAGLAPARLQQEVVRLKARARAAPGPCPLAAHPRRARIMVVAARLHCARPMPVAARPRRSRAAPVAARLRRTCAAPARHAHRRRRPLAATCVACPRQGAAAAADKEAALLALCARALRSGRCIVFFRTKQRAHRARMLFGLAGVPPATELHGNMTQAARLESLERFRTARARAPQGFVFSLS